MKINPTARQLRVLAGGRAEGAVKPTFPAESPLRTIGLRTLEWSQYRAGAIQSGPAPVQRFTLAPLFPLGTLSVLFGPGGVGKSLVALDLCLAVARQALKHGMGNLDHAHAAGPLGATVPREAAGASVFLTLEDSRDEIHRRLAAMNPTGADPDAPVFILPAADWIGFDPTIVRPAEIGRQVVQTTLAYGSLDSKGNWQPSDLDVLLDDIEAGTGHAVKLLVLDPAGDFLAGPENDAEYVKVMMRLLRDMAARRRMSIILVGHVAKGEVSAEGPTMRGSSAWIDNSRAAYALWPPDRKTAGELATKTGAPPEHLVFGMLRKANHAGAPISERRLFQRDATCGRLIDITHLMKPAGRPADNVLINALVAACAEAAAAGMPFVEHATGGLYDQRDDLPPMLASMSKGKLAELSGAALKAGRLVKAKITPAGVLKYLDAPDGTLARGHTLHAPTGSRREAVARYRAFPASQTSPEAGNDRE